MLSHLVGEDRLTAELVDPWPSPTESVPIFSDVYRAIWNPSVFPPLPNSPTCIGCLIPQYTTATSKVLNAQFAHHHQSTDYSHGGTSAGCDSCGGSGSGGGLAALDLGRIHRYRDLDRPSSCGPGAYLSLDKSLILHANADAIEYFDPDRPDPDWFTRVGGATVFTDPVRSAFREIALADASNVATASIAQAATATIIGHDGGRIVFEVIHPTDTTAAYGRLTAVLDRNGIGYRLTYQKTVAQAAADRASAYQIDRVIDALGNQFSFTYAFAFGSSVVTRILPPNGHAIGYRYGSGGTVGLTDVDLPDLTTATVRAYMTDSDPNLIVAITDPAAEGIHRNKTLGLTLSGFASGGTYFNQPPDCVRWVRNGSGELVYQNWLETTGNLSTIYVFQGGGAQGAGNMMRYELTDGVPTRTSFARTWDPAQPKSSYAWEVYQDHNIDDRRRVTGSSQPNGRVEHRTLDPVTGAVLSQSVTDAQGKVLSSGSATYNAFKQPLTQTDANGVVTAYTYDAQGNLLTRREAVGTAAEALYQMTYNAAGQVLTETDPRGNTTNYAYDARGLLLSITAPADHPGDARPVTQFTYTAAGQVETSTDPEGRQTIRRYDARNRLERIDYADGSNESFAYGTSLDDANQLVRQTDRNGNVTRTTWDGAGRRVGATVAGPDGVVLSTSIWNYLVGTDLLASTTVDGESTTYAYDTRKRLVSTTVRPKVGEAQTRSTVYDDKDQVLYTQDAFGRRTFPVVDADGKQVRSVQELVPGAVALTADLATLPRLTTVNPTYTITDQIYDIEGRMVRSIDARGIVTEYGYDVRGRQTTVFAAARQIAPDATVAAIQAGTAVLTTLPEAVQSQSDYDAVGNVVAQYSPRYFDLLDSAGYHHAYTVMTYTGRNLLESRTSAPDTLAMARQEYTYTPTGKVATERTLQVNDATPANQRWSVTQYHYGTCCDRLTTVTDPLGYQTRFDYDPVGNRTSVTDANNLTTTTTYDGLNRVATVTNAAGETTAYAYFTDATGLTAIDLPPAITPAQALAGLGLAAGADGSAVVVTNPLGEKSVQITDGAGRTVRVIDGNGNAMSTNYDNAIGADGLLGVTATDALGNAVSSRANAAGQVRQTIDALGKISTAAYDSNGNRIAWADPNGVGGSAVYDGLNRLASSTDTAVPAVTTQRIYDTAGNAVRSVDGLSKSNFAVYDALGRKSQTTDRIGAVTDFTYDNAGNLLTITDGDADPVTGQRRGVTRYGYDLRNLLVHEEFPPQSATGLGGLAIPDVRQYTYDAGRRLATRTDQLGVVTRYDYDPANRLTARRYPDNLNDTFFYDPASRLTQAVSQRSGTTVNRRYTSSNDPRDPTAEHAGRLLREEQIVTGKTFGVEYVYDAANRKTGVHYPIDAAGHVDPAVTVVNAFTARNQLEQVWFAGESIFARGGGVSGYDDAGRLVRSQIGTAGLFEERRTYALGDNLISQIRTASSAAWSAAEAAQSVPTGTPGVTLPAGSLRVGFGYQFDALKRKTAENDLVLAGWSQRFAYDDESRLNAWDRTATAGATPVGDASVNGDRQVWQLSKVGDWKSTTYRRDGIPDRTETRDHSPVHEVTGITYSGSTPPALPSPNPQPLRYDGKGNLTIDDHNLGLAWDPENRLVKAGTPTVQGDGSVTVDPTIALYSYDALGRRLAKTVANGVTGAPAGTTYFVHDGAQVVVEFRESSTQALAATVGYAHGSYVDEVALVVSFGPAVSGQLPTIANRYYLLANHLYSPAAAVDNSGNVVEHYKYDAYGKHSVYASDLSERSGTAIGNAVTVTGRYLDNETGLVYFRARQYSTGLGRFVGRDPLGYVDGAGLYGAYYVPNGLDPSGNAIYSNCSLKAFFAKEDFFKAFTINDVPSDNPKYKYKYGPYMGANPLGWGGTTRTEILMAMVQTKDPIKLSGKSGAGDNDCPVNQCVLSLEKNLLVRHKIIEAAASKKYQFPGNDDVPINPIQMPTSSKDLLAWYNTINNSDNSMMCALATNMTVKLGYAMAGIEFANAGWIKRHDTSVLIPGDRAYFINKNNSKLNGGAMVGTWKSGLEGENVIYVGKGMYWGHFSPDEMYKTEQGWTDEIRSWKNNEKTAVGKPELSSDIISVKEGMDY